MEDRERAQQQLLCEIAERRKAEELLRIERDLSTAISTAPSFKEALNRLLDITCEIEPIDCGGVYLVDQLSGELHLVTHRGLPAEFVGHASDYRADSPHSKLVMAGKAVFGLSSDILPNLESDRRKEGIRALAVLPVQHAGKIVAVLNLASHTHDEIPEKSRTGLKAIASQIASSLARAKAEEALREHKQNLQALFDTLEDFLFILDLDGSILHTNPAVRKRLGFSDEELAAMNAIELHPPNRREEAGAIIAGMAKGELAICPVPLMDKCHELIPVETRVTRGKWGEKEVLIGVSRDLTERRLAEEKLLAEHAFRTAIINHAAEGLAVYHESGEFPYVYFTVWNDRMCQLTGYSKESINSCGWFQTMYGSAEDAARARQRMEEIKAGNNLRGEEWDIIRADGQKRRFSISTSLLKTDPTRPHILAMILDVTERREATRIIEEHHQVLEETVEKRTKELRAANRALNHEIKERRRVESSLQTRLALEQAVASVSTRFVGESGIDKAINESLAEIGRLRGASRAYLFRFTNDLTRMNNTHEWCNTGVAPQLDKLQQLPSSSVPWWMERLRNGEAIQIPDVSKLPPEAAAEKEILEGQDIRSLLVLPLYMAGALTGFLGFDHVEETSAWQEDDIYLLRPFSEILGNALERKEAERMLRLLSLSIEQSTEGIAVVDLKGTLLFANDAFAAMHGYSAPELPGKHLSVFHTPDQMPSVEAAIRQIREEGEFDGELWHARRDGTIFPALRHNSLIRDERGIAIGMIGTVLDITEEKRAEEALRRSEELHRQLAAENARLLEQARRDAETKTTLLKEVNHRVKNNLAGIIGLLRAQERFSDGNASATVSEILGELASRVEGLSLVHEMLSNSEWSPLELGDLVQEVVRFSLHSLPQEGRVSLDTSFSPILVGPDQASSLALVINELVTNTVKHTLAQRQKAQIKISTKLEDGTIHLRFQDDGPGYPEGTLRPESRKMGMYLVENIVRNNLRGTLELQNCPGATALITFRRTG